LTESIVSLVGAISGVASLFGIVYMLAYWKGRVDAQLRTIEADRTRYPVGEFSMMTKTLWDIYVIDALRGRPDLAEHGSAYRLKKEAQDLIPDNLKAALDQVPPHNPDPDAVVTGYEVVKRLGLGPIHAMAEARHLTLQESIAILSCYLDEALAGKTTG